MTAANSGHVTTVKEPFVDFLAGVDKANSLT